MFNLKSYNLNAHLQLLFGSEINNSKNCRVPGTLFLFKLKCSGGSWLGVIAYLLKLS